MARYMWPAYHDGTCEGRENFLRGSIGKGAGVSAAPAAGCGPSRSGPSSVEGDGLSDEGLLCRTEGAEDEGEGEAEEEEKASAVTAFRERVRRVLHSGCTTAQ